MAKQNQTTLIDEFTKQKNYVQSKKESGKHHLGIVLADAFIRGIRDLGYKSPATALDEIVDNSIQASSSVIEVVFAFEDPKKTGTPDSIAVVDNGHGMIPEMIRYAVMWGGTHRENDRTGFGRYGYGLPSAAVSMSDRYTVYSKTQESDWHAVTIDLQELADRAARGEDVEVPAFRQEVPPAFVVEGASKLRIPELKQGTVVVLERLDRVDSGWKQTAALKRKLLEHFGVIYRHYLPQPRLLVDGEEAEPVDPLFLMEHCRFYGENEVMASPVETKNFDVTTDSGATGLVKIRASWMPANFTWENPKVKIGGSPKTGRFRIMKEYNGLLICRNGRQIDCVQPREWTVFQNWDRYVKIELDFDPSLDSFFGVTTSKQQITLDPRMWDRLEAAGVRRMIRDLRKRVETSVEELEAEHGRAKDDGGPSASEAAMAESEKMKPKRVPVTPEQREEAEKKLEEAAKKAASKSGKPVEDELARIKEQTAAKPYSLTLASIPEGPFYRPERLGAQKVVVINTSHRFYSGLYNAPGVPAAVRSALEVLIFALADGELDADGEFLNFYRSARSDWSRRLDSALAALDANGSVSDRGAIMTEEQEMAAAESEKKAE